MRKFKILFLSVLLLIPLSSLRAEAADTRYTNPDTGYRTVIEDDADLLTAEEERQLEEVLRPITEYGNAAFKSVKRNAASTRRFAENFYRELFGSQSGTLFLIDMDNRQIYLWSNGYNYSVITESYADSITDNCYRDATKGKYYDCAEKVFTQVNTLLSGNRIAQPMKWTGNVLLALTLAFLINYFVIHITSTGSPKKIVSLEGATNSFALHNIKADYIKTTKERIESSGGGGGGSGGGGVGGGGGGGGGGHSF